VKIKLAQASNRKYLESELLRNGRTSVVLNLQYIKMIMTPKSSLVKTLRPRRASFESKRDERHRQVKLGGV
jgi:hypothetical protein